MRFAGRAYRAHDPRWAFKPTSGDGAGIYGARFNPKGVPALYLSLDPLGAILEAQQGFAARLPPLTLCEYDVDCDDVIDLSTDVARAAAGVDLADLGCAWKLMKPAPSQQIARRLISSGAAGIIVPSFSTAAAAHSNLVLWTWSQTPPHRIEVFDPSGRLPKDQLSWT